MKGMPYAVTCPTCHKEVPVEPMQSEMCENPKVTVEELQATLNDSTLLRIVTNADGSLSTEPIKKYTIAELEMMYGTHTIKPDGSVVPKPAHVQLSHEELHKLCLKENPRFDRLTWEKQTETRDKVLRKIKSIEPPQSEMCECGHEKHEGFCDKMMGDYSGNVNQCACTKLTPAQFKLPHVVVEKNMRWAKNRVTDRTYKDMEIGDSLPPLIDKHLRQLAAGYSIDSMKVFMARALMYALANRNCLGAYGVHQKVGEMAKEVDLDFCDLDSETTKETSPQPPDGQVADPVPGHEGGRNTGVQK
jgi:hypothetical protein